MNKQAYKMQQRKHLVLSFVTNLALLLTGFVVVGSGFSMQLNYHMGHHGSIDVNRLVWGLDFWRWSDIHKTSIVIMSFLAAIHVVLHWHWYRTVVKKNLLAKNKLAITLTIAFFVVAMTGYIPWFIGLTGGSDVSRKIFIEVHDKITLVLSVCLVIHVAKRYRWFVVSYKKLNNKGGK